MQTVIQRLLTMCGLALFFCGCGQNDPAAIEAARPASTVYEYNEHISFSRHGKSHRYTLTGWSPSEEQFTWTEGIAAALAFRVPAATTPVTLNMTMTAFRHPPELVAQPVQVILNGTKIADWEVADFKTYSAEVPTALLPKEPTDWTIDLLMPRAIAPAQFAGGSDPRRLGLQVFDLVISTAPAP